MVEQETMIRDQAETIGELRATVATLRAENATLTAPTTTHGAGPSPVPSTGWSRAWAVYGGVGLLVVVPCLLTMVLLAFPR
jgi:hypothetical protein